jgi:ATP-dependent helicase/nuclease subunit A
MTDSHRASPELPREIVLASAGTGKTFRLSSRIIGLLNAGVLPQEILASTFTRKAAGEILERVLIRLAQAVVGEKDRVLLAEHAGLPGAPVLDAGRAEQLLTLVVEALHRMNVSTLDAFFHRVARAFSLEMGLVPGWEVADEADGAALVTAAVDRLLAGADREEMGELLRLHRTGEVGRGVHGELLAVVEGIQRVARELDPLEPHPWGFPSTDGEDPPRASELEALAWQMERAELPLTRGGTPNVRWAAAAA